MLVLVPGSLMAKKDNTELVFGLVHGLKSVLLFSRHNYILPQEQELGD